MEKESNNTNVEVVEKKKTFSWIIIVFLLLVIAGILFYFMYYKPKMDQKPVPTPTPTQTEVDEPTDPEDPGIYDPDEPMEDVDIESTDVKDSKDNIIGVIKESDYKKATYYLLIPVILPIILELKVYLFLFLSICAFSAISTSLSINSGYSNLS